MKTFRLLAVALMCLGVASFACADTMTTVLDVDWDTSATGLVASGSLVLPPVASVKSISIDISHTWTSDVDFEVVSPAASTFVIQDSTGSGGSTLGDLGIAGTGTLDDVATYTFAPPTGTSSWGELGGVGPTVPEAMPGPAGPGIWTFNVFDDAGGDGGAVGSITIDYNVVPEPATGLAALLGVLALIGRRRMQV